MIDEYFIIYSVELSYPAGFNIVRQESLSRPVTPNDISVQLLLIYEDDFRVRKYCSAFAPWGVVSTSSSIFSMVFFFFSPAPIDLRGLPT